MPPSAAPPTPTRLPACLRGGRAAAALLTRIPVGGFPFDEGAFRWAPAWFPVVGAALGLLAGLLFEALAETSAGPLLAAAVTVAALLLLTGALHEDGLADTADALGGARDREALFAILKDSRIGTFGAAALACSLLVRVAAVAALDADAAAALVFAGAWSRLAPVWLMARLPYVTPAGGRHTATSRAGAAQALLAAAAALLVAFLVDLPGGALFRAAVAAALCTALAGWRFRARAGGITGDFLGAAQQLVEVAVLVTLAASAGA